MEDNPAGNTTDNTTGNETRALRTGYTTGACATACALAAARCLLGVTQPMSVAITLPRGQRVEFALDVLRPEDDGGCYAAVIKDAGDDPDVTHRARVWVRLQRVDQPGVVFHAGAGVGTVTRAGLSIAVGEPAINPVPRRMLAEHLQQAAAQAGYSGGWALWVGVDGGEQLALKTMNPRLGIVGGLSILGTTGIVRPYSCAAFVASIHQGIDVARANGLSHIAATTGSTSERGVQALLGLDDMAIIEMGDMAGAVLKYLRRQPLPRFTLAGGLAKLSKLAAGHLDLHSSRSSVDGGFLAGLLEQQGAPAGLCAQVAEVDSMGRALLLTNAAGCSLAQPVCRQALAVVRGYLGDQVSVEVVAFDRAAELLARAS